MIFSGRRERWFNTSRRKKLKIPGFKECCTWEDQQNKPAVTAVAPLRCSTITSVGWNNSDPTGRLDIRKRFFTEGMAAQSRQRIWGWSLPAGMSCSAGTRKGKAWQRVGITTACGSATFQLQLQDLLTPQRKSSSADKQELGLLQASLKFSFIPYQDELKLQINKLLRKL